MIEEKDFVIGIRFERQQMTKYVEAYQLGDSDGLMGMIELERFNYLISTARGAEKKAIGELVESIRASLNLSEEEFNDAIKSGLI